jgi:hypothetical protein
MLEVSIGEYDQAVVDLTAAVVAGILFSAFLISRFPNPAGNGTETGTR